MKDEVDILIKCLVNIKQGLDHPVSVAAAITRHSAPFVCFCNYI